MSDYFTDYESELYDAVVPDWPGEIAWYQELAAEAAAQGGAVLELACGTGRVALRLARRGGRVVGLEVAPAMLKIARAKSAGLDNVRWVDGDMRSFDLGEQFALVIIPGHSFQFMLTPADQLVCLETIKRHLVPGGRLVVHLDHQSFEWLASLKERRGAFKPTEDMIHPGSGNRLHTERSWRFEPSTQTATVVTVREERDEAGQVIGRWETAPKALHCVFRFEMEHLLARAGLTVEALYGDFLRQPLHDDSPEMIWVARTP
jgi:SAM-dependent methyltransferase